VSHVCGLGGFLTISCGGLCFLVVGLWVLGRFVCVGGWFLFFLWFFRFFLSLPGGFYGSLFVSAETRFPRFPVFSGWATHKNKSYFLKCLSG